MKSYFACDVLFASFVLSLAFCFLQCMSCVFFLSFFPPPGVGAASSGKLTFMVGGAEEEFTAAKELLSCMGANVVYCGQVGTGQVRARLSYFPELLGAH